jgi:hypothetical protein
VSVDKVQARKMVLVSMFLLAAIAVYKDKKSGASDTFRALWAVGVVSEVLAIAADFAPTIAGPFAALAVLGSLTSGGSNLIGRMLGTVAAAPAKQPAGTTASGRPATPAGTVPRGGTQ